MKHSEDIKMKIGGKFINDKYKYVHQLVDDLNKLCKQVRKEQYDIHNVSKCTCKIPEPKVKCSENGINAYCCKCAKSL